MNILVLNCGSSSLKFQVLRIDLTEKIDKKKDDIKQSKVLAKGIVERIGSHALVGLSSQQKSERKTIAIKDHTEAIDYITRWLISDDSYIEELKAPCDIDAVGHRVVHGGEKFKKSALIDASVIKGIEDCIELAPLHNPANLAGIAAAERIFGKKTPQIAVFDTAFHANMPEIRYIYPIPYQFYRRHKLRRYGFHGSSHRYISYRYRKISNCNKEQTKIITLHLGNGCSACAIDKGVSVATSMGITPLEGLPMGTRSGDIDPSIPHFLHHKEGLSYEHIFDMLNQNSGLLGISGLTHDMRELIEEEAENQDHRAKLAIDIFCDRIKSYIGSYMALLNGADAIIFSGGIGENSSIIRERVCDRMSYLGISLDKKKNEQALGQYEGIISTKDSTVAVYVIPTNEERLIAEDAIRCLQKMT